MKYWLIALLIVCSTGVASADGVLLTSGLIRSKPE